MGEVMHVQCGACKGTWRCAMGNGLAYADKKNIIAAFWEKEREQVETLLAKSGIPVCDFRYGLAVCTHCHNVVSVPALGLSEDDEPYVGLCPVCGRKTRTLCREEENVEAWSRKTACPVCKSMKLEIVDSSYWD